MESARRQQSVSIPDEGGPSPAPLRLRTLGELRLEGPHGDVRSLRRKDRVLLAFLARAPGPVARAELAALLWGRSGEARARQSLRQALFALRRVLGDALEVRPDAVRLRPGAVALDLATLEQEAAAGRPAAALGLWGGEFLPGLEDAGDDPLRAWIDAERATLRPLVAGALDSLMAMARADGEWADVIGLARRWAEANPWDEAAHARLVAALRDAGRLEEAVAWHGRAVARLGEELGQPPTPAFLDEGRELALRLDRRRRRDAGPIRRANGLEARRAAVADLLATWRGVQAGSSAVVRVASPPHLGTTFCDELVAAVRGAEPAFVLRLSAGAEAEIPAWRSAARLLAPLRSAPGLSGVADAALAEVTELVPSIRARFPRLPPPQGGPGTLGRAAIETIRDVAAEVPVLVVVDGADRCDPQTRRWLPLLAELLPPHTMLVVAAPPDAATDPATAIVVATGGTIILEDAAVPAAAADPGVAAGPGQPAVAAEPAAVAVAAVAAVGTAAAVPAAAAGPGVGAGAELSAQPARRRGRRARGAVVALVAAVLVSTLPPPSKASPGPAVLAVGSVRALGEAIGEPAAMAMPELLSTQLARVDGLEVVSRGRMQELLAVSPGELAAARVAGATHVLEGELYVRDGRHYLEIRRLDARTGRVQAVHAADAEHPLDLAHGIAAAVATALGRVAPAPPASGPASVAARALYEAGLQAFHHRQDHRMAQRLFAAALDEDPGFGMAALFAARSASVVEGHGPASVYMERAEAAANDAPERDRLYIRASAALHFNDPAGLQHAEQLAAGFPAEPAGPLLLGHFLTQAGRFPEAARQYHRVLAMHPPVGELRAGACAPCDAYAALIQAYWAADSLDAAIRVASEWAALHPLSPDPLTQLAALYAYGDKHDQAIAARQRAARFTPDRADDVLWTAAHAIRRGDFAAADAGLDYLARASSDDVARRAAWLQVISLRHQGRHEEAWGAASRYRELAAGTRPAAHPHATPQAVVLMETGGAARAGAMFDTMFHNLGDLGRDSRTARDRAWLLTLRATALAAAGDTTSLAALADEVQRFGRMSSFARDQRLHHHVRGLLLRARGDLDGAERELRAAIYSTTAGFTRTNVDLAAVLIELGRPDEAIPLLHAALRAPLDGPALYVTRTAVLELIERASGYTSG